MVTKLRDKLKAEGRTINWFFVNYIKDRSYSSFVQQVGGFVVVQKDVKLAIASFMKTK